MKPKQFPFTSVDLVHDPDDSGALNLIIDTTFTAEADGETTDNSIRRGRGRPKKDHRGRWRLDGLGSGGSSSARQFDGQHLTDRRGSSWELRTRRKDKYDTGNGRPVFMQTFLDLFELCIKRRIRGESRTVVDWLCLNITTDNLIAGVSRKRLAEETGVSPANVSIALARLESHEILLRDGPGKILLNPRYFFLGEPKRQHLACRKWDDLQSARRQSRLELVRSREQAG